VFRLSRRLHLSVLGKSRDAWWIDRQQVSGSVSMTPRHRQTTYCNRKGSAITFKKGTVTKTKLKKTPMDPITCGFQSLVCAAVWILRDIKRVIHGFIDSTLSKFGRGEWHLTYTWKGLTSSCSSIPLVTPIARDTVVYDRRNTVTA
jgi:hypothetical protein